MLFHMIWCWGWRIPKLSKFGQASQVCLKLIPSSFFQFRFFSPETEVIAIILNNDIFFKVRSLQKECPTSWSLQPIQTWRNIVFQQTAHTAVTFDSFKRFRCQFCFEGSLMCSPRLLLRLRYFKINFLYVIDNSFLCRCFSSTRTRKKS